MNSYRFVIRENELKKYSGDNFATQPILIPNIGSVTLISETFTEYRQEVDLCMAIGESETTLDAEELEERGLRNLLVEIGGLRKRRTSRVEVLMQVPMQGMTFEAQDFYFEDEGEGIKPASERYYAFSQNGWTNAQTGQVIHLLAPLDVNFLRKLQFSFTKKRVYKK